MALAVFILWHWLLLFLLTEMVYRIGWPQLNPFQWWLCMGAVVLMVLCLALSRPGQWLLARYAQARSPVTDEQAWVMPVLTQLQDQGYPMVHCVMVTVPWPMIWPVGRDTLFISTAVQSMREDKRAALLAQAVVMLSLGGGVSHVLWWSVGVWGQLLQWVLYGFSQVCWSLGRRFLLFYPFAWLGWCLTTANQTVSAVITDAMRAFEQRLTLQADAKVCALGYGRGLYAYLDQDGHLMVPSLGWMRAQGYELPHAMVRVDAIKRASKYL